MAIFDSVYEAFQFLVIISEPYREQSRGVQRSSLVLHRALQAVQLIVAYHLLRAH
jgi:hypothetical protein